MAKPSVEPAYEPVLQELGTSPGCQVNRLSSITSYWRKITTKKERRPHNLTKDGIMGEISGCGLPVLLRWRASLWKSVWKQLLCYLITFLAISLTYRFLMDSQARIKFEWVVSWLKNGHQMPLTFLLGFYVSLVVKRWWEQYVKLPWPDEVATLLKAGITEKTAEEEREEGGENLRIRRTVIRYLMLSYVLCLRRISSKVRSKYPDMDSLLASRLIRADEAEKIGSEDHRKWLGKDMLHGKSNWWMPIKWSVSIVRKAMKDKRTANAPTYSNLVKAIAAFRKSLTEVVTYGHVTVPLVYTQVVQLAVYFHFAVALVGRQWVKVKVDVSAEDASLPEDVAGTFSLDSFIPIFLVFEFLFYMGWLNVAAALYNPFGEDDDDFAVMGLMNRHIKVCMKLVDDDRDDIPEVQEDEFWKAPPGAPLDWQPSLDHDTPPLEVQVVNVKPESESSPTNWSEIRKVMVDHGGQQDEEEAVCIEPQRVSLAEIRDPGKVAR